MKASNGGAARGVSTGGLVASNPGPGNKYFELGALPGGGASQDGPDSSLFSGYSAKKSRLKNILPTDHVHTTKLVSVVKVWFS